MKELNLTEQQLRSWQPRRPAAGLERKIFSQVAPQPPAAPAFGLWRYVAPAMACVWLTFMAWNHTGDYSGTKTVMALDFGSQSSAVYAAGNSQTVQNHLAGVTFDWTNRSGFKSIIGFTPTTNFSN